MHRLTRFACAASALLLALAMCGCYLLPTEEEPVAPPLVPAPTVSYKLHEVELGDIVLTMNENGSFVSETFVDLAFESRNGRVKEIYARAGIEVKAGDPLVEMDSASLLKDIERQEIAVQKQKLAYEQARKSGNTYNREVAELDLRLAEITLEDLNQQLEACILRSPIDGIILWIDPNLIIGAEAFARNNIIRIGDPSEVLFEYQGSEAYRFKAGVEATVITGDGERHNAVTVMAQGDAPPELAETMKDKARLRVEGASEGAYLMGQTGRVELLLNQSLGVVVVPRSVVQVYMGRKYVNILTPEGIREERDVETGLESESQVEIKRGLEPGEMIILR